VLRRIFVPRRKELTRKWRKLHNEELNYLYSSLNIVQVIKSREMKWAGKITRMRRREEYIVFWWENLRERDQRDPGIDGRVILGWIFRKWYVGYGLVWAGLRTGGSHCDCGNEILDSINCGKFLNQLQTG
jgi:hypothetical protein